MRILLYPFLFFLLLAGPVNAAPDFPALTGRVVDDAHMLSAVARQSLEQTLADYEAGTTNQVVVVTLPSLHGDTIEDYGYQLGRHWKIGQQGKNNGALLIVAAQEHKVRIEVGYGLEPLLTDAASSEIINGIIIPDFHAGHMEQGIIDGTQAILAVLGGKSLLSQHVQDQINPPSPAETVFVIVLLVCFLGFAIRHPWIALYLMNSSRFGSSGLSSGGWGGGGGFSGGGGSFGGGGASGGW